MLLAYEPIQDGMGSSGVISSRELQIKSLNTEQFGVVHVQWMKSSELYVCLSSFLRASIRNWNLLSQ
jgi:hypothetical protein